jgi:RNA polymerase sigma factor (sigma-70 family)
LSGTHSSAGIPEFLDHNRGLSGSSATKNRRFNRSNTETHTIGFNLTQLYHNDRGKLLHFCRMRISNASDAEDLVQEAFLSVGRAYPDKDGEELRALLFTTLRNLTLDYLKSGRVKAGKVTSEITDKGDTLACTRTVTPEKAMMDRQTLQQVSEILETIAPRQKQALLLSRLERLTHDEIAKRLGVSPRTVRNDITDALAAITKGLARKERGL